MGDLGPSIRIERSNPDDISVRFNMTSESNESENDCVQHGHPVPAHEIPRYSVERDSDSESDIARYVEIEASDETVQHVEKVKDEYVVGEKYEIWDVITDKSRWWVISNITNLYNQQYFPSLDYTISFHIGLMMRLKAKQGRVSETEPDPFDEVFRRIEQAEEKYPRAVEPEDFQAVAMQLREALLSLVSAVRRRCNISDDVALPKEADFKSWSDLLAETYYPGLSNKSIRSFIKSVSKETWQLVNWLTHHRDARSGPCLIAIEECKVVIGHFVTTVVNERSSVVLYCPRCGSRNLRSHFDPYDGEDGEYYESCGACGWSDKGE